MITLAPALFFSYTFGLLFLIFLFAMKPRPIPDDGGYTLLEQFGWGVVLVFWPITAAVYVTWFIGKLITRKVPL
jgi:hypothetical protein